MVEQQQARVVAVAVSYQARPDELEGLLAALAGQVHAVVLVDNASPDWRELDTEVPLTVLRLERNLGLAAAQNRGIELALKLGAVHILLLDQDSLPLPGMVAELREVLQLAGASGLNAAAVGPLILNAQGRYEGFVRFGQGRYQAHVPEPGRRWLACDLLIASGCLIDVAALARIGPMKADLFIDKVDTEWCLRAVAAGYCLLGAPQARLRHRLGERVLRVWFGRWRELAWHAPFRYYYMVRNGLLLRRLPHASPAWRAADRRQLRSLLLYFGLLAPRRWQTLRMMGRGLWDGLRGRSGALD